MDPQELNKLGNFSHTLANVLSTLDSKYREVSSGKALALTSIVEKHSSNLQSLEKAQQDQKEAFDEAMSAQNQLYKDIMELTSSQCKELHDELISMRLTTKQEITRLQGSLQISLQDSIEQLCKIISTGGVTEIPSMTRDMTPDKLIKNFQTRLQLIEGTLKSQEIKNQMFQEIYEKDKGINDRFDELTHRVVLLERNMNSDKKRLTKIETSLFTLLSVQSKMENAIKLMDQKIIALIRKHSFKHSSSNGGNSPNVNGNINGNNHTINSGRHNSNPTLSHLPSIDGDGTDMFEYSPQDEQLELDNILHTSIGDFHIPIDTSELLAHHPPAPKYESPLVREKKELLRQTSLKKSKSTESIPGDDNIETLPSKMIKNSLENQQQNDLERGYSGGSFGEALEGIDEAAEGDVDSEALMEEYLLEQVEALNTTINEEVLKTMKQQQEQINQLLKQINDKQANELLQKHKSKESIWNENENKLKQLLIIEFQIICNGWKEVIDEFDKQVSKMDYKMRQTSEIPNTDHIKMYNLRQQLKNKINIMNDLNDEINILENSDDILNKICPFLNELMNDSNEINSLEGNLNERSGLVKEIIRNLFKKFEFIVQKTIKLMNKNISNYNLNNKLNDLNSNLNKIINHEIKNEIKQNEIKFQTNFNEMNDKINDIFDKQDSFMNFVNESKENDLKNKMNDLKTDLKNEIKNEINKKFNNYSNLLLKNNELNAKIEAINNELNQLNETFQQNNISREEIEGIFENLFNEIKNIKKNSFEKESLNEKLKKKVDVGEIDKIYTLLSGMGDLHNENGNVPAAMHSKCLVCDKPVNSMPLAMIDHGASSPSRSNSPTQLTSTGYDKKNDINTSTSGSNNNKLFTNRPTSSHGGLGSTGGSGSGKIAGRAQSAKLLKSNLLVTETNIMKNSMEYFPPVTNGNNNLTPNPIITDSEGMKNRHVNRRIRSATGGGLQGSYQLDTR